MFHERAVVDDVAVPKARSGEQAEYTDVQNEVYNGFANMLTGTNWGVSSLQFSTSQYKTLGLVSAIHPVHTSYYCWMLVDAR